MSFNAEDYKPSHVTEPLVFSTLEKARASLLELMNSFNADAPNQYEMCDEDYIQSKDGTTTYWITEAGIDVDPNNDSDSDSDAVSFGAH